jgi:hypothetical protein
LSNLRGSTDTHARLSTARTANLTNQSAALALDLVAPFRLMDHRGQFRSAALALNLPADEVERFIELLRFSIALGGSSASDGARVGQFGGLPRLPVRADGQPDGFSHLPFVFSLDCAALPRVEGFALPVDGSLLFFLDHDGDHLATGTGNKQYARVVHLPAGTETAVAEPAHPELVSEQYDVGATLVATLPDCLEMDDDDMSSFQQRMARDLRSGLPHLEDLSALADELWPPYRRLASAFLGGYVDDDVLVDIAERNLRERVDGGKAAVPRAEWWPLVHEEQRRLTNEWTSLATFPLAEDYYYGNFSIRHDDLAAGRFDKMVSLTWFSE